MKKRRTTTLTRININDLSKIRVISYFSNKTVSKTMDDMCEFCFKNNDTYKCFLRDWSEYIKVANKNFRKARIINVKNSYFKNTRLQEEILVKKYLRKARKKKY